jgi:alanyl-tRNA synthetase
MTQRLYYDDSYTVNFSAQVVERFTVENRPAVILDQTYFYPTGGGQPNDLGKINDVPVTDVFTREGDSAVVHVLAGELETDAAMCHVDWARRFDYMQHHTGQHILTQAFVQAANAHTVSFHLSPDSVTIDLGVATIAPDRVNKTEDLANHIIYENRPITARLIDPNDSEGVRMRRMPGHLMTDGLRVIDIENFDLTACGGTHVARTGEIGVIKIVKLEKRGDKTRVEFRCGGRALRDYREKNNTVNKLIADLTCGTDEVNIAVARVQDDFKQAQRALKAATNQLLNYEAERLLRAAGEESGVRIVKAVFVGRDAGELRLLANRLIETPGVIALLGAAGDKAHLVLARSANLAQDMSALLKNVLPRLGDARGGGQPSLAQGGGVKTDAIQVQAALDEAERAIQQI